MCLTYQRLLHPVIHPLHLDPGVFKSVDCNANVVSVSHLVIVDFTIPSVVLTLVLVAVVSPLSPIDFRQSPITPYLLCSCSRTP